MESATEAAWNISQARLSRTCKPESSGFDPFTILVCLHPIEPQTRERTDEAQEFKCPDIGVAE